MRILTTRMRIAGQLAFSHDGRHLIVAGTTAPVLRHKPDNRGIEVWNLDCQSEQPTLLFPDQYIVALATNPRREWLCVGTGPTYRSEIERSGTFVVHLPTCAANSFGPEETTSGLFDVHPSGEWIVGVQYCSGGLLTRWRHPTDSLPVIEWQQSTRDRFFITNLACDPAGGRVVTHQLEGGRTVTDQVYELLIHDAKDGAIQDEVPLPGRTVEQLVFSPDGAWLVLRGGPSLLVWDARELHRKPRKLSGGGGKHFTHTAFHPSGRFLAATSNDATVSLYDTATWTLARAFDWDASRLCSVAFSPDGMLAAVGTHTSKVILWDVDL